MQLVVSKREKRKFQLIRCLRRKFFRRRILCFRRKGIGILLNLPTSLCLLLVLSSTMSIHAFSMTLEENENTNLNQEHKQVETMPTTCITNSVETTSIITVTSVATTTHTQITSVPQTTKPTTTTTEINKYDIQISSDMDLSKPTGMSEKTFCEAMENLSSDYTGFFCRNAKKIWALCQKYHINEIFFVGLIGAESGWASHEAHVATCNYTSIMSSGHLVYYDSEAEGLTASAALLGEKYLDENGCYYRGGTLYDIAPIYSEAPDHWTNLVYGCMNLVLSDIQS